MKKYLDEKAMTRFRKRAMTRALPQDHIYHEITHHLLERLDLIRMKPSVIVNAGWHTAVMHQKLQQQYPQAKIIDVHAVDELLSLQAESVDLVIACFVLLCERDPIIILQQFQRILRNEGLLLLMDWGPDTLMELRMSFSAVDVNPHVQSFADMHHIGDWMKQLHFSDPVMDREMITLAYDTLDLLFRDLKAVGVMNAHEKRSRGLMSVPRWKTMLLAYAQFKTEDYYPASLEITYGHGWKVKSTTSADEIYISVEAIQRR